jgi:hypothetical protein
MIHQCLLLGREAVRDALLSFLLDKIYNKGAVLKANRDALEAATDARVGLLGREYLFGQLACYIALCCQRAGSSKGSVLEKSRVTILAVTGLSGRGKTAFAQNAATLIGKLFPGCRGVGDDGSSTLSGDFLAGWQSCEAKSRIRTPRDDWPVAPQYCESASAFVHIFTSFNNETMLSDDALIGVLEPPSYGEDSSTTAHKNMLASLFYRILHSYFGRHMEFRDFVAIVRQAVPVRAWICYGIGIAFEAIAKHVVATTGFEGPVPILWCIDEYQCLNEQYTVRKEGYVTFDPVSAMYDMVVGLMCKNSSLYVLCPMYCGLYLDPLVAGETKSKAEFVQLVLNPLSIADTERFADVYYGSRAWRGNPEFQKYVFLARCTPKSLIEVLKAMAVSGCSVASLESALMNSLDKVKVEHLPHLLRLIACWILGSEEVEGKNDGNEQRGYSVAQWELCGYLLIDRYARSDSTVSVPYSVLLSVARSFRLQVQGVSSLLSPGERMLLQCIIYLCDHLDSCVWGAASFAWHTLEVFGGLYHAMRINCFVILGYTHVRACALLPGAVLSDTASSLMLRLKPVHLVALSSEQFLREDAGWPATVSGTESGSAVPTPYTIANSDAVFLAAVNQTHVDVFAHFSDCYVSGNAAVVFDVLLFDQRKLRVSGGLEAAMMHEVKKAPGGASQKSQLRWFRKQALECSRSTGKRTGFLFGVVNPANAAGTPMRQATAAVNTDSHSTIPFAGAFILDQSGYPEYIGVFCEHPMHTVSEAGERSTDTSLGQAPGLAGRYICSCCGVSC